jgi:Asparagine synthase
MLIATDPEQILASGLASVEPDDAMVMDYLLWDIHHVDRSFLRDIRALAPGYCLEAGSLEEAREEFQRVFMRALEVRIRSSYPVVAQLSGGLDSTSIVCAADRLLAEKPHVCPRFVAAGVVTAPEPTLADFEAVRGADLSARVRNLTCPEGSSS